MTPLPRGWTTATVADTGDYINGLAFKPSDWQPTGRPIIRIQNLTDPAKSYNRTTALVAEDYVVRPGDILVSWSATLDAFIWTGEEAILNQHIFRVRPAESVTRRFLYYLLKHSIADMRASEHLHGSTMKHINRGPFLAHRIGLPPLTEQSRIAAHLDDFFEQTRAARERLERLLALFDRLKRSILAAAFRGDLSTSPRGTPHSWQWSKLGSLSTRITSGSRGWAEYYSDAGARFIRSQDISSDELRLADVAHVSIGHSAEAARTRVQAGDVLLTITGANVTRCAPVTSDIGEAYISQHVALIRPSPGILTSYLHMWLLTEDGGRGQLKRAAYGLGKPGLNLADIGDVDVPLPSLDQQAAIVSLASSMLLKAEALAARAATSHKRMDALERAALAKAFRGELVAQDPNDEPASVLLERIRAARAAEPTPAKRGRKVSRSG